VVLHKLVAGTITLALGVAIATAGRAWSTAAPTGGAGLASGCARGETAIVVNTSGHRLHLCRDGAREQTFTVALGVSGVDKRRQGDNRTPIGVYPLGAPRASQSFHRFIPVAYPTPAQQRAGYSGSAIGIHGPPRGFEAAARLAALVATDWTAGCIAVASDGDIERIVGWVDAHRVRTVRLVR
jgi:L,D-peptidoglycan transpeptidase YkuD (ErfK/YbiS/YcfS/YnhG family)